MKEWLKVSLILCSFGFFREMRPSEPFVTEFLSGHWRNITSEQVNREVYPMGTYSYLAQLIIVFLVTDILRYKPIIVLSAVCGIILWSLLLWTYTLTGLQIVQVFYGTFMAAEVAYYTYMYAKVERSKYQQVTGHARAGILSGRFLASVLAQILVSLELMDLRELNYISFGSQIISLVIAVLLPSVGISLYFYAPKTIDDVNDNLESSNGSSVAVVSSAATKAHKSPIEIDYKSNSLNSNEVNSGDGKIINNDNDVNGVVVRRRPEPQINNGDVDSIEAAVQDNPNNIKPDKPVFSFSRATALLWHHFISAYSNLTVLQWSIWWALAMCGFLQVQSYIQLLWQQIDPDQENFYNGAVEAALTLFGALGALAAGFLNSTRYEKWEMLILTVCSVIEGGFVLIAAYTKTIWIAYLMYVLFGVLYQFMITVASATVAKNLIEDSFALIFGINTLVALIFQTIMTIIVVADAGLGLDPRGQFVVFGSYFLVLAAIYGIVTVFTFIYSRKKGNDVTTSKSIQPSTLEENL